MDIPRWPSSCKYSNYEEDVKDILPTVNLWVKWVEYIRERSARKGYVADFWFHTVMDDIGDTKYRDIVRKFVKELRKQGVRAHLSWEFGFTTHTSYTLYVYCNKSRWDTFKRTFRLKPYRREEKNEANTTIR